MLVGPNCYPCYFEQALSTLQQAGIEGRAALPYLQEVAHLIGTLPQEATPAYTSSLVLQHLYRMLGDTDPFARAKRESNREALKMAQRMRKTLDEAKDPLLAGLRLAVAGNMVDMGILGDDYDLDRAVAEVGKADFDPGTYSRFKERLTRAHTVFIIGDNSGEIAFDVLLAAYLKQQGHQVYYGVKSYPILNDATREDAVQVGMPEVATVIANGNGFLGTIWEELSPEFREMYERADLVLAKGQANFESLEGRAEAGEKTFFLLRAKCPYLAGQIGARLWDWLLLQNQVR